MLPLYRLRLPVRGLGIGRPHYSHRRYYVQNICEGFIDLAVALPIPTSFPAYSTTIIVVTLLSRLAMLPVSIWVHLLLLYHPNGQ